MFSLCRLCANPKDAIELNTSISELESKLILCCEWSPSKNESQMPNKACTLCVQQLRSSWCFAKKVKAAEEKLGKLVTASNKTVNESIEHDEIIISETIKQEPDGYLMDIVEDENFSDGAAFADSVHSNERSLPMKDCAPNLTLVSYTDAADDESNLTMEGFFDKLDVEDCLPNGKISDMALIKLNEAFPEKFSWNHCQYKCDQCRTKFNGPHIFVAHNRKMHTGFADWIDLVCFYCDSKHKYEDELNRHIAIEHFTHLKYR